MTAIRYVLVCGVAGSNWSARIRRIAFVRSRRMDEHYVGTENAG